jgi:alpha-L-arabinofuranosidase
MAAIDDLYTYYAAQIAAMTDQSTRLQAYVALATWKSAREAHDKIIARVASSYSNEGGSFSMRLENQARESLRQAQAELEGLMGTGGSAPSYSDLSGGTWDVTTTA